MHLYLGYKQCIDQACKAGQHQAANDRQGQEVGAVMCNDRRRELNGPLSRHDCWQAAASAGRWRKASGGAGVPTIF